MGAKERRGLGGKKRGKEKKGKRKEREKKRKGKRRKEHVAVPFGGKTVV
jgi:hypothetical protein